MQHLLSQIKACFIVAELPAQLHRSKERFCERDDSLALKRLTQIALAMLGGALLLWLVAGYHGAFHLLNQFTPCFPATFWQIVTFMGDTTFVLTLALLVARRKPELLWVLFIAAIYGTLATHGLKTLFGAERPPVALLSGEYNLVGKALRNGSFPSGHSFTAFAFVAVAYYFFNHRLLRIGLLLSGGLIGLSRVMVAAHWPVDVLVGGALGMLVTVAAIKTAKLSDIGFRRPMHLFIVFLLLVAALMIMSGHTGGYPQAQLFAKVIAFAVLLVFVCEYFLPARHPGPR
ncbi:phosphatase PAP2 family protein [Amphritea pacifica]|uniref:undecaprenyl-diphosphate phosphatase n=1 Tax=Amphritea pacifica TaxID=2811233 RepID=A0ABS2W4A8_9GAMM|nr:phosphatase PAP2 family protein [Amphritea pacifica]MBN0986415.1 phosphatase PAP2 family protein [Amphritea pacifica]MBN1006443.1 phosphatase PAP2 family protein [Amphritea pacifica]